VSLLNDQRVCALIPAAGQGTRLGLGIPKIILEIADGVTVWHLLHRRLRPWVERIHVVLSPAGLEPFRRVAGSGPEDPAPEVSVSVQERPTGMGDAVFGAAPYWEGYDTVLVVWGDQAGLSEATVREVIRTHRQGTTPRITLPLVAMAEPYVEYEYDAASASLLRVRQSREGDECRPGGLSDVGVFCLSTDGLMAAWQEYLTKAAPGAATGEVNFLPFLPYLSRERGWPVTVVPVTDQDEARGINTAEDLEFARQAYRRCAN
jgi:N-acetylglucosamine-1-phosphate uridyltransferase (contains nucleotidyltransferase and I-patch acetyltransferase domains)